nr:hypothetical protein [Kitasatospora sp. K002]
MAATREGMDEDDVAMPGPSARPSSTCVTICRLELTSSHHLAGSACLLTER